MGEVGARTLTLLSAADLTKLAGGADGDASALGAALAATLTDVFS